MNCYIACNSKHKHEGTQILICDECGTTKETCIDDLLLSKELGEKESFLVKKWNLEIHGVCAKCI